MYKLASDTIAGMAIGQSVSIEPPSNLPLFRKYISDIGKRTGRKFNTRLINGQLVLLRVEYSNIYTAIGQ